MNEMLSKREETQPTKKATCGSTFKNPDGKSSLMVEQSIELGTQWVVFEPNDHRLWKRITRDISAFLLRLWRQGALFGQTPEEAFYVKCDEETNPPEVIDAGQLIVEIGMCPVKPAEFVIFRIGQMPTGGDVSE